MSDCSRTGLTVWFRLLRVVDDVEIVQEQLELVIEQGHAEVVMIWDEVVEVAHSTGTPVLSEIRDQLNVVAQ